MAQKVSVRNIRGAECATPMLRPRAAKLNASRPTPVSAVRFSPMTGTAHEQALGENRHDAEVHEHHGQLARRVVELVGGEEADRGLEEAEAERDEEAHEVGAAERAVRQGEKGAERVALAERRARAALLRRQGLG